MIESSLIQELLSDTSRTAGCRRARRDVLAVLQTRFGTVSPDLAEALEGIADEDRLTDLVCRAAACPDLEAFRNELE